MHLYVDIYREIERNRAMILFRLRTEGNPAICDNGMNLKDIMLLK